MKASKELDWRVVFPIAVGSLGFLVAALIARNDALGSFLLAVGGASLVVMGFWYWSE